ncbi:MAG: DNA polymerase III subunit tau, partial [Candidatus Anoxychlamydiales bacterium]|nr:DNA polymerase III subunit tau [Candidatus Anoxychlamydiales bacterium]
MDFSNIIGNSNIKKKLNKAIENNNLSNTLLFSGPSGVGKYQFAKILAYYLMYPSKTKDEIKLKNNNHPDLHIYTPCGKTSMHLIASIRDLISEVHISPFEAKAKVFIIKDANRMHSISFNALLKTLEEPTFDSYIILITENVDEILPTIISRCFKMNFSALTNDEISSFIQRTYQKDEKDATAIAKISLGSITTAIELCEDSLYLKKREFLFDILLKKNIYSYFDLSKKLDELEEMFSIDKISDDLEIIKIKKEINLLLNKIIYFFRDLYILKENIDKKNLFFFDKIDQLEKLKFYNLPSIEKIDLLLEKVKLAISRNIKLKVAL